MRLASFVLLATALFAAGGVPLEITDARGKKASGVTIDAGGPDAEGWWTLKVAKSKGDVVLIWPWDGLAKQPDGPGAAPVVVIQKGDAKALTNPLVVAAIATPVVLGRRTMAEQATAGGFTEDALKQAIAGLVGASDPFAKGIGLLFAGSAENGAEELTKALRVRQRQLTRVPSEIFPMAMLQGRALLAANKFDEAAVAFLNALKIRPADESARQSRAEALLKAGKADAAAAVTGPR